MNFKSYEFSYQFRYELRDDRKREKQTAGSHIDLLRHEIMCTLHGLIAPTNGMTSQSRPHDPNLTNMPQPGSHGIATSQPIKSFSELNRQRPVDVPIHQGSGYIHRNSFGMVPGNGHFDMFQLKQDIISSIRTEVKESVEEVMATGCVTPAVVCPPVETELYQTHLYTQL